MGNVFFGEKKPPESFSLDELVLCDPLPNLVDLECPICLQVMLYDPCLVSCCGHHFCGYCITQAKRNKRNCPYCKTENYDTMADKGLERIIKSLRVKCTGHLKGCQWKGELIDLVDHLKRDSREGECLYSIVECKYKCDYKKERNELSNHEVTSCPKRPYQCEYCGYKSTYVIVTTEHTSTCQRYPISCPNHCEEEMILERRFMDKHLVENCPLAKVTCDYHKDGCNWKGERQALEFHYAQNCPSHLMFVHKRTNRLEKDNGDLKKEIKELNSLMKNAARELREQSNDIRQLQAQIRELKQSNIN